MISQSQKIFIIGALVIVIVGGIILMRGGSERPTEQSQKTDFRTPPVDRTLPDFTFKEKAYLDVIKGDPDNAEAHAELGDLYFENNRFQQSIAHYRKAISLKPGDVDSYNDLGLALHYTGQTDSAADVLKKGTDIDPSYQRIWLSYGFILINAGKPAEAENALKRAIDLDPQSGIGAEAQRMLGAMNTLR